MEQELNTYKEFNEGYEGETTILEQMHLEYQKIIENYPDIINKIRKLPSKSFSGKNKISENSKGVFFCYNLPSIDVTLGRWTEEAGQTKWYLYLIDSNTIVENQTEIINHIRCKISTERKRSFSQDVLIDLRKQIDTHIKNTYLRSTQAPIGVKPTLKAWMELS